MEAPAFGYFIRPGEPEQAVYFESIPSGVVPDAAEGARIKGLEREGYVVACLHTQHQPPCLGLLPKRHMTALSAGEFLEAADAGWPAVVVDRGPESTEITPEMVESMTHLLSLPVEEGESVAAPEAESGTQEGGMAMGGELGLEVHRAE